MTTPPLALIAELTHRCPLHCVYCSNPLQLRANFEELPTEVWIQVLEQAAKLGMFQVHFTGGEPLARSALNSLVSVAHSLDLYTNLITSGIGLNEKKLASLIAAGLDHLQLSFQDSDEGSADRVAGVPVHARKVALANLIHECKSLAFTVNLVVHRHNLDRLESIISFAESLGPQRIEIANVQYYGWALKNREWLLPTCEQVQRSVLIVQRAQERLKGRIKVDFVTPDYYASFPKPCMGGWGRQLMLVDPSGRVLPCHAATVIPGMDFENVREKSLSWIWEDSGSFRRFRGEDWMPEPCRSCDRRTLDFGGCRCQAFLVTGDEAATDPVCSLAPAHSLIEERISHANLSCGPELASLPPSWTYRTQSVPSSPRSPLQAERTEGRVSDTPTP